MRRYIFIGSVEYSAHCLRALLDMNLNIISIMCPYKESAKSNSDYFDLKEVARYFGRDVYYFENIKQETDYIRRHSPDIVLVLGLSQIIPGDILGIPAIGCIGSHPALLPKNRGRHPIIWAIANGIRKSGITFFWIDEGVDSGDIWAQKEFDIDISDDALSVYKKVAKLSVEILRENIPQLERGIIKKIKQDDKLANYWRKRTYKDGEIDWRMSDKRIYDLIRALTKPYVGAHCIYKGKEIKVWKSRIIEESETYENIEPGKVISINYPWLRIKTGEGIIEIMEHSFDPLPEVGEYL